MKIFFSWQSDIPASRHFITQCLEYVATNNSDLEIETATRNAVGSPDIAATILKKIDASNLFLADVSVINSTAEAERKCPNPNVMYELGYAVKALGEDNIILIANRESTNTADLPFDIRNRRMILENFSDSRSKNRVIESLINAIANYSSPDNNDDAPRAMLSSEELTWASNYSGHGASFRTEVEIDNYGGASNYLVNAKLQATNSDGEPWETNRFIVEGTYVSRPLPIPAGEMLHAAIYLTDDPQTGRKMPDLDSDTVKLILTFRSSKTVELKYKPGHIRIA